MTKLEPISVSKIQYLPCKTSIQTRPSNSSKSTRPFKCARKGRRQRRQQLKCRNDYNVETITIRAGSPPNTSQVSLQMCGWECTGTPCHEIGAQVFHEYRLVVALLVVAVLNLEVPPHTICPVQKLQTLLRIWRSHILCRWIVRTHVIFITQRTGGLYAVFC